MKTLMLVLDGERPISWNKFYSGLHWGRRKREADRVHALINAACAAWKAKMKKNLPVFNKAQIILTAYFKDHPLDASNICVKLYEDGLIHAGVLKSDKWDVVTSVTTASRRNAQRPRVELRIEESV